MSIEIKYTVPGFLYIYSSILNVLTCAVIIVTVLVKNPRSILVRLFCIFTGVMGCWAFLYLKWVTSRTIGDAEFFVRSLMIFTALMPPSFLHFISELSEHHLRRSLHLINYLVGAAIASTVYTPYFASYGSKPFLIFLVWPVAGPIFFVQLVHFLVGFGTGFLMMYRVIRHEQGLLRTKIVAVFWGTLVAVATGATNYLPWVKIYVPPIFPPFLSLFVCFYAYAIVKHQLMDIEVIIKRTLVFAGLVAFAALLMAIIPRYLLQVFGIPRFWTDLAGVIIVAASFGWVRDKLVNVTDHWLFQKKYDYRELLRKFTDELVVGIKDLKQLVHTTVYTLAEIVKLDSCSLLLFNKDTRKYKLVAAKGTNGRQLELDEQEPFITFLHETHEPIGRDGQLGKVRFPETVTNRLTQLNARLCLPLIVHDELIGVLCLGKKKSDEEFTKDDLDILLPLAGTAAIAVNNALALDELAKTQAEAAQKEKLAVIGTLAAGMAHEIKNPLTSIKTFSEYLPQKYDDPVFREKFARIMSAEVGKINELVQRLLDFAKPDPPHKQIVRLSSLIDEVIEFLGGSLLCKHIGVRKSYVQEDTVLADPSRMKQVLLNVLLNSIDALPANGAISISTVSTDALLEIKIADNGCGISKEELSHVFDPFYTTKPSGTGLGLLIVQTIIREHGGRVLIESEEGRGTTVTISLPCTA